jgi:hypothetical protein
MRYVPDMTDEMGMGQADPEEMEPEGSEPEFEENVKIIREPVPPVNSFDPIEWDDTPEGMGVNFDDRPVGIELASPTHPPPSTPAPRPVNPSATTRANHIADGARLAASSLDLFREALDTVGIVDISTHEKYEKTLQAIEKAVNDFENKL